MTTSVKEKVWVIRANILMEYLVCFEDEVTPNEAKKKFLEGEYEDIIDEEPISDTTSVVSVSEI